MFAMKISLEMAMIFLGVSRSVLRSGAFAWSGECGGGADAAALAGVEEAMARQPLLWLDEMG